MKVLIIREALVSEPEIVLPLVYGEDPRNQIADHYTVAGWAFEAFTTEDGRDMLYDVMTVSKRKRPRRK